jgi:nucleotide-binding universal stress UspA family protein
VIAHGKDRLVMNYRRAIVPLDGSELAESVLPHLEAVASNCQITTAELVRVVPPIEMHFKAALPMYSIQEKEIIAGALSDAEKYLLKVKARLDTTRMNVTTKVLSGDPAIELMKYIEKSRADLLVIATHGRSGVSHWVWGSVTEKLLHISCVPVFVIRPPECKPRI